MPFSPVTCCWPPSGVGAGGTEGTVASPSLAVAPPSMDVFILPSDLWPNLFLGANKIIFLF